MPTDLEIIEQLEQKLNIPLNKIFDIRGIFAGYQTDENQQVIGLSLYEIGLTEFPLEIVQLQSLQILDVSFNKLTSLPKEIYQLKSLQIFDLEFNQLTSLPKEIALLQNLKELSLAFNELTNLPKEIAKLQSLQKLHLEYNKLRNLPKKIGQLQSLQELYLGYNKLTALPKEILNISIEIQWEHSSFEKGIYIENNPLESPPPEIIKQGNQAIKDYLFSLKDKTIKLKETKVLLVGEGMAGKTSLLKQLQDLPFDKDESQTHGINIISLDANQVTKSNHEELKDCKLHFWDFGGQEIMHASHQFFLNERSLYILVLDSRTNDNKIHHWLKHIEKYGDDSPTIVLINKIDENPNYNIEQNTINQKFKNISNRFFRISCKNQDGFPELLNSLAKTIPETSLFATDISVKWMKIKNELVEVTQNNNYINRNKFIEICNKHEVNDQSSQNTLLQFLHDLGIVLYFKELNLANIYVLDPHWVTIGVYKILNSHKIKNGILNIDDLDYILNDEETKKAEYDPAKDKQLHYDLDEQRYIVNIMEQFELCYKHDNYNYIIPDLLPKELTNEPRLNENNPLRFKIEYDYLPSSIISRLMLRLKNDIRDRQQWKYGMILENNSCIAKIKADKEDNSINITIQGEKNRKREYFSVIRHHIHDIAKGFENLKTKELIPLPNYPGHYASYKSLLNHEKKGKEQYYDGDLDEEFSVSELLDSVITKKARKLEIHNYYIDNSRNIMNNGEINSPINQGDNADLKIENKKSLF